VIHEMKPEFFSPLLGKPARPAIRPPCAPAGGPPCATWWSGACRASGSSSPGLAEAAGSILLGAAWLRLVHAIRGSSSSDSDRLTIALF
jgi:hypothetical protein